MANFQVESYRITCGEGGGFGVWNFADRTIFVESPDLSHGIRNRAIINFMPKPGGWAEMGIALNVGGLNFDGITFVVTMPTSCYDDVYEILRHEAPVYFAYNLANQLGETSYWVNRAAITTATGEIPGEGPVDPDALPQRLAKVGSFTNLASTN